MKAAETQSSRVVPFHWTTFTPPKRNSSVQTDDHGQQDIRKTTTTPINENTTATFEAKTALKSELPEGFVSSLVGDSSALREVRRLISKVAPTNAKALITGETGVGKELAANDIHANSTRKNKPLIPVNCAAIPKNTIESVLFGHEVGAFTDARNRNLGLFDAANDGTIFLDEIGELDRSLQVKLARVLDYSTFQRVGGTKEVHVDTRVLAATNCDLQEGLTSGKITRGLYDRLSTFHIHLPPLRERQEDVVPIALHLLERNRHFLPDKIVSDLTTQTLDLLEKYDWPGNVRQLENVIRRAIVLAKGGIISQEDIALTNNDATIKALEHFEDIALSSAPVLIAGGPGAGKELIARRLHSSSRRAVRPLIVVNCAALREELLESELFGHVRGAFTGAVNDHNGFFEVADGATLLLDEVGELSLGVQPKLLRALQQGEIVVMGTNTPRKVNVRIIATTNHDLEQDVKDGKFREDLFHRLSVIPITIPPLRERTDEIPDLVTRFFNELKGDRDLTGISDEAMAKLQAPYEWPGNIRQLKGVIERATILADEGSPIQPKHIILDTLGVSKPKPKVNEPSSPFLLKHFNELIDYALSNEPMNNSKLRFLFFKYRVAKWVSESRNLQERQAAEASGINSFTLRRLVKRFGYSSTAQFIKAMTKEAISTSTSETNNHSTSLPTHPVSLHHLQEMIDYTNLDEKLDDSKLRFLFVKYRIAKIAVKNEKLNESRIAETLGLERKSVRELVKKYDYNSTGELVDELNMEVKASAS